MNANIFIASTDEDINACFPVFSLLRPHVAKEDFLPQVRRQQSQQYQIMALRHEGVIASAVGFRTAEFFAWGKIIYIDDLTTLAEARGNGFANQLLDRVIEYGKATGCKGVHLDSGYTRFAAHRLYLKKGWQLSSHHFALQIEP